MKRLLVLASASLIAGVAQASDISREAVIDALKDTDVAISDFKESPRDPNSPLPNSYRDRFSFVIESAAPKGGQVFICDEKRYCDAIAEYFEMLSGLAGPYRYSSDSGLVFAQLNSGLRPAIAEKIEAVIEGF